MDPTLLEYKEVLQSKKEYRNLDDVPVYIYFLIKGDEIVYVGQTTRLNMRLKEHSKDKEFDSYSFIEMETNDPDLVSEIEKGYIIKFSPIYNKRIGNYNCITIEKLTEKFGLDEKLITELISDAYYEGKYRTDISIYCIQKYLREKRRENIDWAAEIDKYL